MGSEFNRAEQKLPRETYFDADWYQRECRELFDQAWTVACTEADVANPGDFYTLRFMDHSLFVVRGQDGTLAAFHNICRHRGCEVLEGHGNTGEAVICPYHRWSYTLDGSLRGLPNESECFPEIDKPSLGLLKASVGVHHGLVYVNPAQSPRDEFSSWIANMDDFIWPHRFDDGSMQYSGEVVFEMHCNWKVFYENAIDGYHLGYLHDKTLGKVFPSKNVWKQAGRNVVWYSTERDGEEKAKTLLSEESSARYGMPQVAGAEAADYPGVVMLFPLTILSPSPWGFYISTLEPAGPELTYMRSRNWVAAGANMGDEASDGKQPIRLKDLDVHPLESGNFQIEDMWIVEKVQRTLRSPNYQVGPLAQGAGAESPLTHFQESVLDYVPV